jgi:hypothetical protein
MIFELEKRPSTCHLSQAFNHEFTIKKPRSATRFLQKPLQKRQNLSTKKRQKYAPAQRKLGVIRLPKIGKEKTLTTRRLGPTLRLHGDK